MSEYCLKSCVWEITLKCCFSCKYCGSKAGKERNNELSTNECLSVVNQLAELGCERVSLIGGEVFMRSDWDIIVSALTKKKIRTSIITNGFAMSDAIINKLIKSKAESVSVSLDSIEPIHDKYRQNGSYQRAIDSIEKLVASNIPVAVISTLNEENVEYLDDFYDVLKQMPLYAWQLQACTPMGNASKGIPYRFDFQKVIDFVNENIFNAPFALGIADNIGYFSAGEGYIRGNQSGIAIFRGCQAGLSSIGIDSIGNVKGCESLYDERFIEGNIRNESLQSIWKNPLSFSYNRAIKKEQLTGNCKRCEYNEICKGGCRSYNYFVHDNLYESPCCALTRVYQFE